MYKKILLVIMFCFFCTSPYGFAYSSGSELSLYLGNSTNLKAFIESEKLNIPLNEHTTIQYADTEILELDSYFNIKPLSVGKTTLAIINNDDFDTIVINIKSPIKEILINENEVRLLKGEIYPFQYTIVKHDDYYKPIDQRLKWTVSKQNIASIRGNNKIYTINVGNMTLTGTTLDGSQSISIDVTVLGNNNPLVIKPSTIDTSIKVGEIRQLKAFFGEKDVTKHVEWESEYPDLLKIDDNGFVTPLKSGTCVVTAKSSVSTRQEDYTFFIKSMVDKIKLNKSSITFEDVGMKAQLKATLTYKIPGEIPLLNGYYYESSNPDVATVDQNGLVTATGKGIALINVISYDSAKRAACTIEVTGNSTPTTINFTAVRDIKLDEFNAPILLGQKIPLTYEITPKEATDQTVKFSIKYGNNDQIHLIDGQYYFVPEEHGNAKIKIAANGDIDDVEDEIEVSVVSPLSSLKLDLLNKRGTENERKLYIGEESQIITEIFTQGNYSAFDVYPNTLEYTVDDSDILKLEYINGNYMITALKKGTTSLRIQDIEGRHKDALKIRVISPISKISTDREVRIPLNIFYTPKIDYVPVVSAQDQPHFNLSKAIHLEVEEFYFSESYIDNEIAYEQQLIEVFASSESSSENKTTIERHAMRLDRLMSLKKSASSGYCLVNNNFLKDRNFESYRYFTINNGQIKGHYPGKVKVGVSINGVGSTTKTLIYWQNVDNDFAIKELTKWITYKDLISENNLDLILANLSSEDQIKYCIYYLSNKEMFNTLPTLDLLKASLALSDSSLPSHLKIPSDKLVSKQDLAYISEYLSMDISQTNSLKTKNIIYYDVINETVKKALAMNYIQADSRDYFGVNTPVDYITFKNLVDQFEPNNNLPQSIEEPFTHEQLILLLNQK